MTPNRRLLQHVAEHPGETTGQIESALGAQRGTVHAHVLGRFLEGTLTQPVAGDPQYDGIVLSSRGVDSLTAAPPAQVVPRRDRGPRYRRA